MYQTELRYIKINAKATWLESASTKKKHKDWTQAAIRLDSRVSDSKIVIIL